jgi:inositol phosphorylceramide mannosyltransferase catalytic subunit
MKKIHIFHNHWQEICSLNKNNTIIYRNNNEEGNSFLELHYLKITWKNYEKPDYFFSINGNDYYQNSNQYSFFLFPNFTYFTFVENNKYILYFCDQVNHKIYNTENYDLYYIFNYENSDTYFKKIIVSYLDIQKTYIYINNYFIEENLYNELYTFLILNTSSYENNFDNIDINDKIINKEIILDNKKNVFYENTNINKISGTYYKYNNYLKIIKENEEYFYKRINNTLNNTINNKYIFDLIKKITINDECKNNKIIKKNNNIINKLKKNDNHNILFIIQENQTLFQYIDIIDYYNNHEIPYLIFDTYLHKNDNSIFFDYLIDYYYDKEEFNKIMVFINNKKNYLLFENIKLQEHINLNKQNNLKITNIFTENKNENKEIPKILHFIWIGKNQIPTIYNYYIQSWLFNHKDWKYYFWDDSNIPILYNQETYDKSETYAQKADILRYELLYKYGGIYIDCDFLCIKPIDKLIENIDGFSAYESNEFIAIGIMGFKKGDLFLRKIIEYLEYNVLLNKEKNIPNQTGPVFFTKLCNLFIKNDNKYKLFDPSYFYFYTYNNKINNHPITYNNETYALHLWGYSWDKNKLFSKKIYNYINPFLLNKLILQINYINNKNIENNLYIFNKNNYNNRKKIVHIMGIFFSGGIEKFIYYFDKYGDHEKYEYILLCINESNNKLPTFFSKIKYYSFENINTLNLLIQFIKPDLIIDHYSIYLDKFPYNTYNNNYIIQIIHSAILYNKDISHMNFKNSIHLYDESVENKNKSWLSIKNNYIISLGTEIKKYENNNFKEKNINKKIHISIIGRIVPEKIPLDFFEKLCILSLEKKDIFEIHIYGEKCNYSNNNFKDFLDYNNLFDKYLDNSSIIYHDFISYDLIHKIYEKTDLLLIPSIYETGSFTCLEAYSYGIPVISRNNYGLKHIIKNNITGYLVNNDDEFIDKIRNIRNDLIFDNYYLILKESYKYNIVEKIKDYENIFTQFIACKNIIIITSVLNISNNPLSYYHKRSVFTIEERFKQTLNTIRSIKEKLGSEIEIFFCECSDLLLYNSYEKIIKSEVSYFYNFYDNFTIRNYVLSKYKGLGELYLIKQALKIIDDSKKKYQFIFKISGRYYLNENFEYNEFNNNYNIMTYWDCNIQSYASLFYKICFQDLLLFMNSLEQFEYDLKHGNSFEQCLYKFFNHNILVHNKLNISGYLSTEGYLFSI